MEGDEQGADDSAVRDLGGVDHDERSVACLALGHLCFADMLQGIFYAPGEEPKIGAEPKLHLLIESNEESRVRTAVDELRRTLVDASMAALNVSRAWYRGVTMLI